MHPAELSRDEKLVLVQASLADLVVPEHDPVHKLAQLRNKACDSQFPFLVLTCFLKVWSKERFAGPCFRVDLL